MSKSSFVSATLFAVALSACAHQGSQVANTAPSYGGQAAQPGGFIPSSQGAAFVQAPTPTRNHNSYLGGQASAPHAWLDSQVPYTANSQLVASCQPAGRAAQPFSGPAAYSVSESADGTGHACRANVTGTRF